MKRCSQHGQALTEFVVISLALIPLFLLMPLIAKYQDIASATQLASRYVAFEATTRNAGNGGWQPVGQLATETRRRFFSASDAVIKTNDAAGNFKADQNLFWRDPSGGALIADLGRDVLLRFGQAGGADHSDAFSAASDGMPFQGPGNVSNTLGLASPGIYTATVTANIAPVPAGTGGFTNAYETFKALTLSVTRGTSIVVDNWSAASPDQVEARINAPLLFPGRKLASLRPLVNAAVDVVESPRCLHGGCKGPLLGQLDFWRDLVPADRLQ